MNKKVSVVKIFCSQNLQLYDNWNGQYQKKMGLGLKYLTGSSILLFIKINQES